MASRTRAILITSIVALFLLIIAVTAIAVWRTRVADEDQEERSTPSSSLDLNSLTYVISPRNVTLKLRRQTTDGDITDNDNSTLLLSIATGTSTTGLNTTDLWTSDGVLQMRWSDGTTVDIRSKSSHDSDLLTCLKVKWTMPKRSTATKIDCIDTTSSSWYGGFEESYQHWPIDKLMIPMAAVVTGDAYSTTEIGNVVEPLLVSSSGFGIYVDETSPLYIDFNDLLPEHFCMTGKTGPNTPYFLQNDQSASLTYHVCGSTDVRTLWQEMARAFLTKPTDIPSPEVFRYPIWSTWAMYKGLINQKSTLEYADDIQSHGFPISQLEIDDRWTPKYGELTFDLAKFPDARSMISNLTAKGIPVTVWTHLFFDLDSDAFRELFKAGYLLTVGDDDDTAALTKWWRRKQAGLLDITNPKAVEWYLSKMAYLQSRFNVTSFKFDAGEVNWLPNKYALHERIPTPNDFTRRYANMAYQADAKHRRQETRVGFKTQDLPLFVRMIDRDSTWSHEKGLKSMIPTALTFSLMGYPFVLPDMIGGNAYDRSDPDRTVLPDGELFVRWLQVTTFFPTLQFSVAPWLYNDTIVNISRKFVKLHEEFTDTILSLARKSVETGDPILRPLWWVDPNDPVSLTMDSEFMLGDEFLIAPVLDQGQSSLDVYLPKGRWRHATSGRVYAGPIWLKEFPAPLEELPYFVKLS